MLAVTAPLLVLFALGDWLAVRRRLKPVEYLCKPAVMVVLVAIAARVHEHGHHRRPWFVAALALSLLGDVFLMLPRDRFVPGLASFLLAHVAYIVGLWVEGVSTARLLAGVEFVVLVGALVAPRIVRATPAKLRGPVLAYMVVISVMVASAVGTGNWLAMVGALLFYASDATIAWNRFVAGKPWAPVFIMVTYHLAQVALVASLGR
jgi:uncharacterized membrane protein YhhN